MRLLLLSDINSSHTQKWALGLASAGFQIGVFSLSSANNDWFSEKQIQVFYFSAINLKVNTHLFMKIRYLRYLKYLKKVIENFKPDILHAHYATSYGLLGALSGFKPLLISVWGSDVFDFPGKSIFHKSVLRYNLNHAERIYSASNVMAEVTKKISKKPTYLIPFGVDTDFFHPSDEKKYSGKKITIGTVKALEKVYGIDILIKAFKIIVDHNPELNLKLLIVGGGSQLIYLQKLTEQLLLRDKVTFAGRIDYKDIPMYYKQIDIFANLSRHESFGVSVLEAMACGKPVVISAAGGLPELVNDGETGLIVKPENEKAAVNAFQRLLDDGQLAISLGINAREHVKKKFDWNKSVEMMMKHYNEILTHT